MKRGLILLFLLLLIKVVNAQEINIFGAQYSLIVVLPFILMVLVLFIFLLVILRDKLQSTKKFNFKFHLFKRKRKHVEKELKPIIDFTKQLTSLKRKVHQSSTRDALNQISQFTKEYFQDKYDIKHEFDLSELSTLIRGHVREIKLGHLLSELKFGDKTITKNQIDDLLERISSLIHPKYIQEEKKRFVFPTFHIKLTSIPKYREKIKPKKLEVHKEIKQKLEAPTPILEVPKGDSIAKVLFKKYKLYSKKNELKNLLHKTQRSIKRNKIDLAKRAFSKAILIYYRLPMKDEELFAARINILGKKLKEMHPKKEIHQISEKLLDFKKHKKVHTKESVELIKQFKDVIKEDLVLEDKRPKLEVPVKEKEFKPTIEVVGPRLTKFDLKPKKINLPTKRVSATLQKLINEENQIYGRLHQIETKELDRFKQKHPVTKPKKTYVSKYHEYLKKIEPKPQKSKKLDSLSQIENKIKQKLMEN